jgi:hypothetical protein
MKMFSILILVAALTACAPTASKPVGVSHGFPIATNEVWNLKIQSKTGTTLLDENFKLDGNFRSWAQTQTMPSGSGTVLYASNEVYEVGLLRFALLPIYSADIGRIRSDKRTGVVAHYYYRDSGSEYYEVFPDIDKTKPSQDSCSLGFIDAKNLQGCSYRYADEKSSQKEEVGTCTFTKLEPAPK